MVRSDVLQVQVYIVTSQTINVVLSRRVRKPMVLQQTAQRVVVALRHVLQVQACVVQNLSTPVTLQHRVLKPMAAQQIMKRVSAAQVRAVQALVFTATLLIISVLDHHAQSRMDQKPTLLNYASVEMVSLAMLNLVSSASHRCWVVLVERMIQVLLVTLK